MNSDLSKPFASDEPPGTVSDRYVGWVPCFDPLKDLSLPIYLGFFALCFAMTLVGDASWHGLRGFLFLVMGVMMVLRPPKVRLARIPMILALGFLVMASMAFLPAHWFSIPEWRDLLQKQGLLLPGSVTAHPLQTLEYLAGSAIMLIVILYLNGHRLNHEGNYLLGLIFTIGVAVVALLAIGVVKYRWVIPWDGLDNFGAENFGFFANRSHMSTLLVMGLLTGSGVAVHSLRIHALWSGLLALISVIICIWAFVGYTESRAALVLLPCLFAVWVMMLGHDYLKGRILVALGLFMGAGSIYFINANSSVKERLVETVRSLVSTVGSHADGTDPRQSIDLRGPIFLDTMDMIRENPWTGVGVGQFQYVFPQYRHKSAILNDAQSAHPESDWFLFAAESGLPATIALVAFVGVIGGSALRSALRGRARALRTGCLLAAAAVPLHGLLNVPCHRMELLWPAALLVAITLRGSINLPLASRFSRYGFRVLGTSVIAAGVYLLHSGSFNGWYPATQVTDRALEKVGAIYAQEVAEQKAGSVAVHTISGDVDRLDTALDLLDNALKVTPMDAHLHYLKGTILQFFEGRDADIDRSFAVARSLDPTWVASPLQQAMCWAPVDANRTESLWQEGMKRAAAMERIDPATPHGRMKTFDRIFYDSGTVPGLIPHAIRAGNEGSFLEEWASGADYATVEVLDYTMPDFLRSELSEGQRRSMFQIWCRRGTRATAEAYARQFHPEYLEAAKSGADAVPGAASGER